MDLLYNNYMRSTGNGPTWCVEIDPPSRPVLSYWEEVKIACGLIYEQRTAPLQLCYSGGLDSEFVLATLLDLDIPVEVVNFVKQETLIPLLLILTMIGLLNPELL